MSEELQNDATFVEVRKMDFREPFSIISKKESYFTLSALSDEYHAKLLQLYKSSGRSWS